MKTVLNALLAAALLAAMARTCAFAKTGSEYAAKCAACHGADGAGKTVLGRNMGLRDLGSAEVQARSDEDLTAIIRKGKGKMPSYAGKLSPEQIADIVKWMRTLKK